MCGRYNLITDAQALVDFFQVRNRLDLKPRYNIAPSQEVPAVRQSGGGRELTLLHWGLIPHWAKDEKIGYRMSMPGPRRWRRSPPSGQPFAGDAA